MNPRRAFLQLAIVASVGAAVAGLATPPVAASPKAKVRVTLIRWPYT